MSGTEVVKGDGWLHAGNALIRSVLHMDPDTLSDEAWGFQVRMAEWVENERVRRYTPTARFATGRATCRCAWHI